MANLYPPAEHLKPVTTSADVINQELSTYRTTEAFHELISVLPKVYGRTRILQSCSKYAIVMSLARADPTSGDTKLHLDGNFFAGSVLGVHSIYRSVNFFARNRYAQFDPLENYSMGDSSFDPNNVYLREVIEEVGEYRKAGWVDLYEAQSKKLQRSLTTAVVRTYGTTPEVGDNADTFTAGFLFSSNLADYALSDYRWRRNQPPDL